MSQLISKVFNDEGDFKASHAACNWLRERGFSVGSMQADAPRAIWYGDCYISKWRGLSQEEMKGMHAQMIGNQRNGPVTIHLCMGATPEAMAAFKE